MKNNRSLTNPVIMKKILLLSCLIFVMFSCHKSAQIPATATETPDFETEISYTVSYSATAETVEVSSSDVQVFLNDTPYPVLNNENERDISFGIYHTVPEGIEVIKSISLESLFSLPDSLFVNQVFDSPLNLADNDDYALLLTDADPENGRRFAVARTQTVNGTTSQFSGFASEGWYSEMGEFTFNYTHHEFFIDDEGLPSIYAEGTFSLTTANIGNSEEYFMVSDGVFRFAVAIGGN